MSSLNIPQHLIQSIGWTLINSLWQALAIYLILKLVTRWIPSSRSNTKYGIGVLSLGMVLLSSAITFVVLNQAPATQQTFQLISSQATANSDVAGQTNSMLSVALHWIDSNIIWLIRFWMLGFVVGLVRIAAGLWYIDHLRKNAHPVSAEWTRMIDSLSEGLKIKRAVAIAEAGITSPMVVGFVKPVILFPVGLLAGLSPEQVETILIHELSHIRRQDYIINLVQAVIETIFFFNPFVLLISAVIRDERENCCDDMVIARGISPITYVRTLAKLEGARSSSTLALGIAGSQNQLLNRIKRIMENSAKNDWGKGRMVPIALICLGLICASWLSVGTEAEAQAKGFRKQNILAADTSRDDGLKVIKSRKNRRSEPLPPDDPEVVEAPVSGETFDYSFDTSYGPHIEEFEMPEMPDMDFEMPAIEFDMPFGMDSIPGFYYRSGSPEDLARFEEEFAKKFKEEFKDFYEKNGDKIVKMMEEIRKEQSGAAEMVDLSQLQNMRHMSEIQADQMMHMSEMAEDMARRSADRAGAMKEYTFKFKDDESFQMLKGQLENLDQLKSLKFDQQNFNNNQFKVMTDQLQSQNDILREMNVQTEGYLNELKELLIHDGYIKKGAGIGNFNINDDDKTMTVNGITIKEKDAMKYRALQDKYFKKSNYERDWKSDRKPE